MNVSVIVPTHNRGPLIARALDSLLPQLRAGDEVLVVDDGSTDDTERRLEPYAGKLVYRKLVQGGAGRARNAGLDSARHPLVTFLDSDDEWLPGKLEVQRALLEARPELVFCYGGFRIRHPDGRVDLRPGRPEPVVGEFLSAPRAFSALAPLPAGRADFGVRVGDLYPRMLEWEYVQVGTMLLRKDALRGVRFPEDVGTMEDWEFVSRLARHGPVAHLDLDVEIVHRHDGPHLFNPGDLIRADAHLEIMARLWGADEAFLAGRREDYLDRLDRVRERRVRALLLSGRSHEAGVELALIRRPPVALRLACRLPSALVVRLMRARRRARALLG